jgi:antitoxin component HigA of HigAB toxin-antitoxin module
LPEIFEITSLILDEQEYQRKIMKLDRYLSSQKLEQVQLDIKETEKKIKEYENFKDFDASQKIVNLTKFLNRDKNELKFYGTMFKLLSESEKVSDILDTRLQFSMKLLKFSNSLKKVHSSLPAALAENLGNLTEFNQEIDKIIKQLQEKSSSGILSPFEFREKNDAAEMIKKELITLCSDNEFARHINMLMKMSEVSIFQEI